MKTFSALGAILGLAGLAQAHMEMIYPAPLKSKANPHAAGDVDYSMTSPLDPSGSDYPCKGFLSVLDTDAGKPTAEWNAGETYNMTITGGANHGGGSCQASLSFDKGKSWSVIHSYVGNCPGAGTTSLDFKVPSDTPSGDVVFAWTWFNKIGNREMYMNCASVSVKGSSNGARALSSRPAMFVANVGTAGNDCSTQGIEGSDLEFPDPGDEVSSDSPSAKGPNCPNGGGSGSGSGSGGDGSDSGAPAPEEPAASEPVALPTSVAVGVSAGISASIPGGVFITKPVEDAPTEAPATSAPAPSAPAASDPAPSAPAPSAPAPSAPAPSAPAAAPSTLLTVTKSAPVESPATESAPAAPAPTSGNGDSSGSGEAFEAGSPCESEGQWNCISGSGYQRCASGQWSAVMKMAQGTSCEAGNTKALAFGKKRSSFRRFSSPRRV